MEMGAIFLIVVALLFLMAKTFSMPFRILKKLVLNSILGVILLLIVNAVGGNFGVTLGINAATIIIAGFCGIPGVAFLIIFKLFL